MDEDELYTFEEVAEYAIDALADLLDDINSEDGYYPEQYAEDLAYIRQRMQEIRTRASQD